MSYKKTSHGLLSSSFGLFVWFIILKSYITSAQDDAAAVSQSMPRRHREYRHRRHHIRRQLAATNDTTTTLSLSSCLASWQKECSQKEYVGKGMDLLLNFAMLLSSSSNATSSMILQNVQQPVEAAAAAAANGSSAVVDLLNGLTNSAKLAINTALDRFNDKLQQAANDTITEVQTIMNQMISTLETASSALQLLYNGNDSTPPSSSVNNTAPLPNPEDNHHPTKPMPPKPNNVTTIPSQINTNQVKALTNQVWQLQQLQSSSSKNNNSTDMEQPVRSNIIIIGGLILLIVSVVVLILIGIGIIILALIPTALILAGYFFFFLFIYRIITGGAVRRRHLLLFKDDDDDDESMMPYEIRQLLNNNNKNIVYLLNDYLLQSNDAIVPLQEQMQSLMDTSYYQEMSCQYQYYLCQR